MASLIVVERVLVKDGDQTVFRHKIDFATNNRVFEHSLPFIDHCPTNPLSLTGV